MSSAAVWPAQAMMAAPQPRLLAESAEVAVVAEVAEVLAAAEAPAL